MRHEAVHEAFDRTAAMFPSQVAIKYGDQVISYRELEEESNRLANFLIEGGLTRGSMVGLFTDSPIQIITSILGVLKSGGVFVPLDPAFPEHRLQVLSERVELNWYLAATKHLAKLRRVRSERDRDAGPAEFGRSASRVICLDAPASAPSIESSELAGDGLRIMESYGRYEDTTSPRLRSDPESPCSVFFTSGSTGKPKPILGRLKGIDHFVRWEIETIDVGNGTRVSQLASPSFDGFLKDAFVPLCAGGVVCAPSNRDIVLDSTRLAKWLDTEQVEVLHCVPSVFRALINSVLDSGNFEAMRHVVLTGEALYPADVKRWMDVFGGRIKLLNLYGTTETTLAKFYYEVRAEDTERPSIPIGKPMNGSAALVMDSAMQPCHAGAVGEIYIRTPYRSLGYYGESEMTREVFIQNPFTDDPGDLIHKTGDYGRLMDDGCLEFLGRRDQQVKVRGVRIELGEVENCLRGHEAVADVAVVDRDDIEGNKVLVAYVTLTDGASSDDLRPYLVERLPEALVPSAFIELDRLPRTLNGKIDRKALPALQPKNGKIDAGTQVLDGIEEIVASIWSEVLGLPAVSRTSSFFNIGGHSLLATQVILRIRDTLNVELPLRSLFEAPTLSEFSQIVKDEIREGRHSVRRGVEPVSRDELLPLSFAQERLRFQSELVKGTTTFHVPLAVGLEGTLNRAALEQAIGEILRRHEILRTSFPIVRDEPFQLISPYAGFAAPLVSLEVLSEDERSKQSDSVAAEQAKLPFDLNNGPLVRVKLIHHSDDDHTLISVLHHITTDGWSKGLLIRETSLLYAAFSNGECSPLKEPLVQYGDFAVWERQEQQAEILEPELAFWRDALSTAPSVLQLATDNPRPVMRSYHGAVAPIALDRGLSDGLKELSRGSGATLFMTLLAAFETLLYRYTAQEDFIVGTTLANRTRSELEGLIGFFVNLLPLRADCCGNPPFDVFLEGVRRTTIRAYAYQEVPFEKLIQDLQPRRRPGYPPLCQVVFTLHNQPTASDLNLPGLKFRIPPNEINSLEYDILLDLSEGEDGLVGGLEYNPDLFDNATAAVMTGHLTNLLDGIVAGPDRRLCELPLLSEEERSEFLVDWNRTETEYPSDVCVHNLFEKSASSHPDSIAVDSRGRHLSYSALNERANQFARYLQRCGARTGDLVGICMGHCAEEVVALLGVLKSGAGYVPLDPEHPRQRLLSNLADSGAGLLITQGAHADSVLGCEARVLDVEKDCSVIALEDCADFRAGTTAQNVAYVIYTSGSTGEPKGVAVEHRALLNYVWWAKEKYLRGEDRAFPLYSSLAFDLTVTSVYVPLVSGSRVVVYPQERNRLAVTEILAENQVEVLKLTPSHLSLMAAEHLTASGIESLIVGGEALTTNLAAEIDGLFDSRAKIYNEYGPTEATVGCMIHEFRPRESRAFVPIGRPAANAQIYVLGPGLSPQPRNAIGEMYIAGDCLAQGYWKRGCATAERFLPSPFTDGERPGLRMYRTGDLARHMPDGALEFSGRADDQVKVRGFRIELGEIEAVLARHPGVSHAAVMADDATGDRRLVAYVVIAAENGPSIEDLRQFLRERLPEYMVPSAFMQLESLPLTQNGKVDRRSLPAATDESIDRAGLYEEPQTEIEIALAEIWRQVLNKRQVGIYDDFFDLGGHSLLAAQIIHRVNQIFEIELPMHAMFETPTIAALALQIEEALIERLEAAQEQA